MGYTSFRDALEVPPDLAQEGLAAAAWIDLRHVRQYLNPLLQEELIRERTAHVKDVRQRRKVYDLTEAGQHAAFRLRDRVKAAAVRVRDAEGEREETVGKVFESLGGKVTLLELVRRSAQDGRIDLGTVGTAPEARLVEMIAGAPRLDRFVGRRSELEAITSEKQGPRVFVVRGVAGIGKSSVAARACELLRGRYSLFWHTFRPWDTPVSVLSDLGEFLSEVGRPGLRAAVAHGDVGSAPDLLREDLPGTHALLVFDDAHEASETVLPFLRLLKDAAAGAPDVRVLVLSRRALPFYDRRDVALRGVVREIDLAGLAAADIAEFLSPEMDVTAAHIGRQLGGHPLFLQLLRSAPEKGIPHAALRDMRRFIEEEVYTRLPEPERRVLNLASTYRVPVPRQALLAGPEDSYDLILSLVNRSLLRPVGEDGFEAHDSIRKVFGDLLAPSERERLGAYAMRQLRDLAQKARESGALVPCVGYLSNALLLTSDPAARADLYESLGDVEEGLGDLPAALTAYKEAMKGRGGAEDRARLHRKSASALRARGKVDAASAEVEDGLRILGGTVCEERAWLDVVRCAIAGWRERWDEAYERGDEALRMFREFGNRQGEGWALYHLGFQDIESPRGDPASAEARLEKALLLGSLMGDVDLMARAHTGLAYLFAYRLGRVESALEHLSAIEGLPSTLRDPHALRAITMLKGWIHLELLGDCDAAERNFREVTDLARKVHDWTAAVSAHTGLARCTYCRGFVEEARRMFEAAVAELLPTTLAVTAMEEHWLAAECCLRLGDVAAFRNLAAKLEDPAMAESVRARPLHAGAFRGVDRLLRGDRDGWRSAFAEAFQAADRGSSAPDPAHLALLHFVYGVTLRAAGESSEASEHLGLAKAMLETYHLKGRQSINERAERELTDVLARAVPLRAS